jgi:hypothetical protein
MPRICMHCGANADGIVSKRFFWNPSWVWLLLWCGLCPFLLAGILTRKTMKVDCRMCDLHRNHWSKRALIILCGWAVVVLLIFVAAGATQRDLRECLFIGAAVLILGWWCVTLVVSFQKIRPQQITETDITLCNVSRRFADNWAHMEHDDQDDFPRTGRRQDPGDYDDAAWPSRRPGRAERRGPEDEDHEPHKRRRPRDEDDEHE